MQLGRHRASCALFLGLIAGTSAAVAQTGRPWVDPPADLGAAPPPAGKPAPAPQPAPPPQATPPSAPAPSIETAKPDKAPPEAETGIQAAEPSKAPPASLPPPARTAQPRDPFEETLASRSEAARKLVDSYLESWSAPNDEALEAAERFYGPRVLFHGRTVSMRNLMREKRRFAKRWPERDYRLQPDTMQVVCNPPATICTVHSNFDFAAANPARGSHTQGTAALRLVLSFMGERPIISAEHSMVLAQSRGVPRNPALEDMSDD